jgi:probable rRNA maturation factor
MSGYTIDVANRQTSLAVDEERIVDAVKMILADAAIVRAEVSVAIVDDATMHALNRRYLDHDYPTDVLSFVLDRRPGELEGEVVVGADTARAAAPEFGLAENDELLLYVIHGTLHLVGYDDATDADRARMRARERQCLARFGIQPPHEESIQCYVRPGGESPAGSGPQGEKAS